MSAPPVPPGFEPEADPGLAERSLETRVETAATDYLSRKRGRGLLPAAQNVSKLIERVVPKSGRAGPRASEIKAKWREIVGDKLAAVSEPADVKGDALVLRVSGAAAPLVSMRAKEIVGLVALAGVPGIRRLSLVRAPLRPSGAPAPPRRVGLDAARRREIETELARVGDDRLRASLMRLAEATAELDGPDGARRT